VSAPEARPTAGGIGRRVASSAFRGRSLTIERGTGILLEGFDRGGEASATVALLRVNPRETSSENRLIGGNAPAGKAQTLAVNRMEMNQYCLDSGE